MDKFGEHFEGITAAVFVSQLTIFTLFINAKESGQFAGVIVADSLYLERVRTLEVTDDSF